MHRLLRASFGLCPRHTWAYAVVEVELWRAGAGARGRHLPFDVTVLYEDPMPRLGSTRRAIANAQHPPLSTGITPHRTIACQKVAGGQSRKRATNARSAAARAPAQIRTHGGRPAVAFTRRTTGPPTRSEKTNQGTTTTAAKTKPMPAGPKSSVGKVGADAIKTPTRQATAAALSPAP